MNYESKVSELDKRVVEVGANLAALAERRKQLAFAAIDGDKAGVAALSKLDGEVESLRNQKDDLSAAIEHAEQLQEKQKAEVARKDRAHKQTERRKISAGVLAIDAEIDTALAKLHDLLERRAHEIRQLTTPDTTLILRLLQKVGPTAAARAAGLHHYLDLHHVNPAHIFTLFESDRCLKGSLAATDENDPTPQNVARARGRS